VAVPNKVVQRPMSCGGRVYRAVRHCLCPGLCRDCSANERDCAVRRRPYAERDGFAHFSKLLMFCLIWIASTRPLYCCCCDWFTIAPIWNGRQKSGWFSTPPRGLVPFLFDQSYNSRPPVRLGGTGWTTCCQTIQRRARAGEHIGCSVKDSACCRKGGLLRDTPRPRSCRTLSHALPDNFGRSRLVQLRTNHSKLSTEVVLRLLIIKCRHLSSARASWGLEVVLLDHFVRPNLIDEFVLAGSSPPASKSI
jgi:hypothetical protein